VWVCVCGVCVCVCVCVFLWCVCGVCVCVCVCVCIKYQENRITSLELLKQQILQTGLVFYLDLQFIFMTFRIFSTVNIFV